MPHDDLLALTPLSPPRSIFLTKDLKVMLGDFGLAKSLQHTLEMAKTPIG
jgi:hypothetical protein